MGKRQINHRVQSVNAIRLPKVFDLDQVHVKVQWAYYNATWEPICELFAIDPLLVDLDAFEWELKLWASDANIPIRYVLQVCSLIHDDACVKQILACRPQ